MRRGTMSPTRTKQDRPGSLEPGYIGPLLRMIKQPRPFMATPVTTLAKALRQSEEYFDRRELEVGSNGVLREVFGADVTTEEWEEREAAMMKAVEAERTWALRNPLAARLLGLVEAVHVKIPNAPMAVQHHPTSFSIGVAKTCQRILDAGRLRGERRAYALASAITTAADGLLGHYVSVIWLLSEIGGGRTKLKNPPKFGACVTLVAERFPAQGRTPALADRDWAHMRNACAHEHVRFDAATSQVVLRDDKGWSSSVSVDVLRSVATTMLTTAVTFQRVLNLFVARATLGIGLFEFQRAVARAAAGQDEAAMGVAFEDWGRRYEQLVRNLPSGLVPAILPTVRGE